MRKLISAFKVSLDMKFQGPGDYADWVPAWSEDYGLGDSIDACVMGGGMYRGYEGYWSAMAADPVAPSPMTGTIPSPGELVWSKRIPTLPHYVLTRSMTETKWPNTHFLARPEQIEELKAMPGKDIYLMGGGKLLKTLMASRMVDELHLIVYPTTAGGPNDLFDFDAPRQALTLRDSKATADGLLHLHYAIAN